jgi:hypothetical protein
MARGLRGITAESDLSDVLSGVKTPNPIASYHTILNEEDVVGLATIVTA